jgi:hypothetical protein
MKKIQKMLRTNKAMRILFLFLFSLGTYAQQDTLVQQRSARKFLREGNALHQQKNMQQQRFPIKRHWSKMQPITRQLII